MCRNLTKQIMNEKIEHYETGQSKKRIACFDQQNRLTWKSDRMYIDVHNETLLCWKEIKQSDKNSNIFLQEDVKVCYYWSDISKEYLLRRRILHSIAFEQNILSIEPIMPLSNRYSWQLSHLINSLRKAMLTLPANRICLQWKEGWVKFLMFSQAKMTLFGWLYVKVVVLEVSEMTLDSFDVGY